MYFTFLERCENIIFTSFNKMKTQKLGSQIDPVLQYVTHEIEEILRMLEMDIPWEGNSS